MYKSSWILKRKDVKRLKAQQQKCLRPPTGYTLWDHICNKVITDHLGVTNIAEDIEKYQEQWRTMGCLRKHYYTNLREGEMLGDLKKMVQSVLRL
jgi:hypothetical protein